MSNTIGYNNKFKLSFANYKELHEAIKKELDARGITKGRLLEYKAVLLTDIRIKDVNKRLRWDMFYLIHAQLRIDMLDPIYAFGCNDDNIDSALKAIMTNLYGEV